MKIFKIAQSSSHQIENSRIYQLFRTLKDSKRISWKPEENNWAEKTGDDYKYYHRSFLGVVSSGGSIGSIIPSYRLTIDIDQSDVFPEDKDSLVYDTAHIYLFFNRNMSPVMQNMERIGIWLIDGNNLIRTELDKVIADAFGLSPLKLPHTFAEEKEKAEEGKIKAKTRLTRAKRSKRNIDATALEVFIEPKRTYGHKVYYQVTHLETSVVDSPHMIKEKSEDGKELTPEDAKNIMDKYIEYAKVNHYVDKTSLEYIPEGANAQNFDFVLNEWKEASPETNMILIQDPLKPQAPIAPRPTEENLEELMGKNKKVIKTAQDFEGYFTGNVPEYATQFLGSSSVESSQIAAMFGKANEAVTLVNQFDSSLLYNISFIFNFAKSGAYGVYLSELDRAIKTQALQKKLEQKGYEVKTTQQGLTAYPKKDSNIAPEAIQQDIDGIYADLESKGGTAIGINMNAVLNAARQDAMESGSQDPEVWQWIAVLHLGGTIAHEAVHAKGNMSEGPSEQVEQSFTNWALPKINEKYKQSLEGQGKGDQFTPLTVTGRQRHAKNKTWYKTSQATQLFEIRNRFTNEVIYSATTTSLRLCVEQAVRSGANLFEANLFEANLSGANLSGANLSGANLSGANLSEANLFIANLFESNLYRANLSEANLSGANLSEADLSRADLSEANLSGANLSEANLSEANLSRANLYRANLYRADLSGANLSRANLSGANLSEANLFEADLSGANLSGAANVNLEGALNINTIIREERPSQPTKKEKKIKSKEPEKTKQPEDVPVKDEEIPPENREVLELLGKNKTWYKTAQLSYYLPQSFSETPMGSDIRGRFPVGLQSEMAMQPWSMLAQEDQSIPIERRLGKQYMSKIPKDLSQEHDSIEEQLRKYTREDQKLDPKASMEELLSDGWDEDRGYTTIEGLLDEKRPKPLMVTLKKASVIKTSQATQLFEIRNRFTNEVIYSATTTSLRLCVEQAVRSEANLSRANLSRADLSEANLSGADLSGANLFRANLSEANLSRADLSRANLYRANLSGADLSGANLFRANLSEANLSGAANVNLEGALNINTIIREERPSQPTKKEKKIKSKEPEKTKQPEDIPVKDEEIPPENREILELLGKNNNLIKTATLFGWMNNLDLSDGSTIPGLGDRVMAWDDRDESFSGEEQDIKRQPRYNPTYDIKGFYYRWIEPRFQPQLFDDMTRDYSNTHPAKRFASVKIEPEVARILSILSKAKSKISKGQIASTRFVVTEDVMPVIDKIFTDGLFKINVFHCDTIDKEDIYAVWISNTKVNEESIERAEKHLQRKSIDKDIEKLIDELTGISKQSKETTQEILELVRDTCKYNGVQDLSMSDSISKNINRLEFKGGWGDQCMRIGGMVAEKLGIYNVSIEHNRLSFFYKNVIVGFKRGE